MARGRIAMPLAGLIASVLGGLPAGALADETGGTNAGEYGALPPPGAGPAATLNTPETLMLELVINAKPSGRIVRVTREGARLAVLPADLARAGIRVAPDGAPLWLDTLPGLSARYDAPRQRLEIVAASALLPGQRLGGTPRKAAAARYDMGALLNYDIYVSGGSGQKSAASLYHEARFFSAAGTVSTTGALRSGHGKAYIRYDSVWRRSDEASAVTVEVGDVVTRGLGWASAVRLGGIQVSRDFAVRPDIITYPLPQFSGSAALPSTVDLIVGGQRVAGGAVDPGPFSVEALPPVSGAGEADLIVTDMHGRKIQTAMPFYVASDLLRPGLTDFAAAFGAFRNHYGTKSFDYGDIAATASLRHGVTDAVTLEIRAEIADGAELAGGGAVVALGGGGVLSGGYSRSFGDGSAGGELTLGYEYQSRFASIALRYARRTGDFTDLAAAAGGRAWRARRVFSAALSFALGRAGTLGVGYFDIAAEDERASRLANAAWTLPLGSGNRLAATVSHDFGDRSWSGALSVSIPLGGTRGTLGAGVFDAPGQRMGWRADYSRALPAAGGWGWNASAAAADGGGLYLRGDAALRTDAMTLRGGAYGNGEATVWGSASGSLVFMDGGLFAANRIADAFVVVNTGAPDIPVRYENQLVGRTNGDGQLLIPWASAYYDALYAIDPLTLPANARVPLVEQRVAVARGSGHVVRFPVEIRRAATATLRLPGGAPVPAGAIVHTGAVTSYVGWEGFVYLEDFDAGERLDIDLPDGGRCSARLGEPAAADATADTVIDLGDLPCAA